MSDYIFKEGDKVKVLSNCSSCVVGKVYPLKRHNGHLYAAGPKFPLASCGCTNQWELIKSNNGIMSNLLTKFKNLTLAEPEKSFLATGIIDEAGELTTDGKEVYNQWRFEKDKAEFDKEVVQKILAAELKVKK